MFKVGDKVRFIGGTIPFTVEEESSEKYDSIAVSNSGSIFRVLKNSIESAQEKNCFTIKQGQIEAAARFVVANNKYKPYQNVEQAINDIKRTIKSMIERINSGQDAWYTATAGWVIMVSKEDDNYYVVEVLVSPDVSVDEEFVNVEEII